MLLKNIILMLCLLFSFKLSGHNVGLLVMATGKYTIFVKPLIDSAEKYFLKDHNVTYFVFTDGKINQSENIVCIYQDRLGWPFDTMMRYQVYDKNRALLETQDYLFACDADMLFVDHVGDEILGRRVATQHPGFLGQRGSYEVNPLSKACVHDFEGEQYFAGGFYGGITKEFFHIVKVNAKKINKDLSRGIIAVWHDESHWNRYLIDHPPTVILSPSYCYPENWALNYPKKLLALDKNHQELRSQL